MHEWQVSGSRNAAPTLGMKVGSGPSIPSSAALQPGLCKGRNLRIADLGAWRGKSYRAGRAVNVGFSQYEPMNAYLQRTPAFRR